MKSIPKSYCSYIVVCIKSLAYAILMLYKLNPMEIQLPTSFVALYMQFTLHFLCFIARLEVRYKRYNRSYPVVPSITSSKDVIIRGAVCVVYVMYCMLYYNYKKGVHIYCPYIIFIPSFHYTSYIFDVLVSIVCKIFVLHNGLSHNNKNHINEYKRKQ